MADYNLIRQNIIELEKHLKQDTMLWKSWIAHRRAKAKDYFPPRTRTDEYFTSMDSIEQNVKDLEAFQASMKDKIACERLKLAPQVAA